MRATVFLATLALGASGLSCPPGFWLLNATHCASIAAWNCPPGTVQLWDGTCQRHDTEATICPVGFVSTGQGVCEQTLPAQRRCPLGYNLVQPGGTACERKTYAPALPACPEHFTLNLPFGCTRLYEYPATCNEGFTLLSDRSFCVEPVARVVGDCPCGEAAWGDNCAALGPAPFWVKCPEGSKKDGSRCMYYHELPYSCPNGTYPNATQPTTEFREMDGDDIIISKDLLCHEKVFKMARCSNDEELVEVEDKAQNGAPHHMHLECRKKIHFPPKLSCPPDYTLQLVKRPNGLVPQQTCTKVHAEKPAVDCPIDHIEPAVTDPVKSDAAPCPLDFQTYPSWRCPANYRFDPVGHACLPRNDAPPARRLHDEDRPQEQKKNEKFSNEQSPRMTEEQPNRETPLSERLSTNVTAETTTETPRIADKTATTVIREPTMEATSPPTARPGDDDASLDTRDTPPTPPLPVPAPTLSPLPVDAIAASPAPTEGAETSTTSLSNKAAPDPGNTTSALPPPVTVDEPATTTTTTTAKPVMPTFGCPPNTRTTVDDATGQMACWETRYIAARMSCLHNGGTLVAGECLIRVEHPAQERCDNGTLIDTGVCEGNQFRQPDMACPAMGDKPDNNGTTCDRLVAHRVQIARETFALPLRDCESGGIWVGEECLKLTWAPKPWACPIGSRAFWSSGEGALPNGASDEFIQPHRPELEDAIREPLKTTVGETTGEQSTAAFARWLQHVLQGMNNSKDPVGQDTTEDFARRWRLKARRQRRQLLSKRVEGDVTELQDRPGALLSCFNVKLPFTRPNKFVTVEPSWTCRDGKVSTQPVCATTEIVPAVEVCARGTLRNGECVITVRETESTCPPGSHPLRYHGGSSWCIS